MGTHDVTLYIYDMDDLLLVATVVGCKDDCDVVAQSYDPGIYGWTYSPVWGGDDGLIDNPHSKTIIA